MKSRPWYKKKRYYGLAVFILLVVLTKMEWAKFRYDRQALIDTLVAQGQMTPKFDTRQALESTIHFLQVGDREELPLLVFVHGSPGALNAYEAYFSDTTMSRHADMISVDRLGFGYSDFGRSVSSLSTQAALIARILVDFPNRKKILIGHSLGGPIIARFAMDYPDLVDGLVMVAPSISPDLEPSNIWRKILDFPLIRWVTPSALRVCNQEIIPLHGELMQMMNGWSSIRVPITVIQGTEDKLVPKGNADFAEEMMLDHTTVKTLMVEGGDHFILWSKIPMIKQAILELL